MPEIIPASDKESSLHRLIEQTEKLMDGLQARQTELLTRGQELEATVKDLNIAQVRTELEAIRKERADIAAMRAEQVEVKGRLDLLDKALPRGGKIYTPAAMPGVPGLILTDRTAEALTAYGEWIHDAFHVSRGGQGKFDRFTRDQTDGTTTKGGFAVPRLIWDGVMALTPQMGFGRKYCTVMPMDSETLDVNTSTVFPAVAWPGESTAPSDTSVILTTPQPRLTAKKMISTNLHSLEVMQDAQPAFLQFVATRHLQAVTLEEDRQVLYASVDPFTGVAYADGVGSLVLGTGSVSFHQIDHSSIVNTMDAADEQCFSDAGEGQTGLRWVFNRQILHKIRLLADTTGQPLLAPLMAGMPSTLLGYPWTTSIKMPRQSGSTASKRFLLFGDWSKVLIGDRRQVEVGFSDQVKYGEAQVMMRVMERVAFLVILPAAFGRLVTAAS